MTDYRMYVDEVGNPGLPPPSDRRHRYLSLTGVIFGYEYVRETVHPRLEELKLRFFESHPDEPVILHRKEIVNGRPPFHPLRDTGVRAEFDREVLALLEDLEYTVVTVVIDKQEHWKRYSTWHFHPYHYCLTVLVERFVLWLGACGAVGDVMAESRGGKEDRKLKESFRRLVENGNQFIPASRFKERLTSVELKVKPKSANIAGLQIADLVAHPSFKATLARHQAKSLPKGFGGEIAKILERTKYNRSPDGRIPGWGRKWLP